MYAFFRMAFVSLTPDSFAFSIEAFERLASVKSASWRSALKNLAPLRKAGERARVRSKFMACLG